MLNFFKKKRTLNTGYKTFISPNDLFSIEMPIDWDEYEDTPEVEGTYAFFNTKEWTGNFRITPLKIDSENKNVAAEYVRKKRNENPEHLLFKIGDFDCIFFKEYTNQDGKDFLLYWWNMGTGCDLLMCSFTIDKEMEGTEKTELELNTTISKMLESIKIL